MVLSLRSKSPGISFAQCFLLTRSLIHLCNAKKYQSSLSLSYYFTGSTSEGLYFAFQPLLDFLPFVSGQRVKCMFQQQVTTFNLMEPSSHLSSRFQCFARSCILAAQCLGLASQSEVGSLWSISTLSFCSTQSECIFDWFNSNRFVQKDWRTSCRRIDIASRPILSSFLL